MSVRWRGGPGLGEGGGGGQRIGEGWMGVSEADAMRPTPVRISDLVKIEGLFSFSLEDRLVLLHLFKNVLEDLQRREINLLDACK